MVKNTEIAQGNNPGC